METAEDASTFAARNRSSAPAPATARAFSAKRFLRYLIILVGTGLAAIAIANYLLDPLHFRRSVLREIAAAHQSGKNYAVYQANLDYRALRREAVALMTKTPQIIVFGGSRFELARADMFPGKTFYNAFVHNDVYEDALAFAGLLYEHQRLPKNLILTARFKTFLPIDPELRETEEFKNFWSEYRAMADRLGLAKEPLWNVLPVGYWSNLFSISNIRRQLSYHLKGRHEGPVDADSMDDMDVLHADGSMAFSKEHSASWGDLLLSRGVKNMVSTAATVAEDAELRAAKMSERSEWPIDPERIEGFGKLLAFLAQQGTHVTIAMTPFHPAYHHRMAGSPYGKSLAAMEDKLRAVAAANAASVAGSLDPDKVGCKESNFRDFIHPDAVCLKIVFAQIAIKD
ncbi:MAG TPA: hypothetical protein VGD37_28890 [Kofleriaceae bacterium]